MSWIGVCDAEQVQEDFPYSGNIDGKEIGIYLIDGEYYALEDVCPHAYALLSGALSKMARWNARCMRRYSTSKPASACMDPAVATLIVTRCGYTTIRSRLPLSRRTWHERILDFNPALPESRQFTPPAEGGNGNIHKPGDYHNLIWQTRSRVPENWELQLIATTETLFEQGAESLGELVNGLNGVRMHDQQGEPWSESSFRAFLQVNGY